MFVRRCTAPAEAPRRRGHPRGPHHGRQPPQQQQRTRAPAGIARRHERARRGRWRRRLSRGRALANVRPRRRAHGPGVDERARGVQRAGVGLALRHRRRHHQRGRAGRLQRGALLLQLGPHVQRVGGRRRRRAGLGLRHRPQPVDDARAGGVGRRDRRLAEWQGVQPDGRRRAELELRHRQHHRLVWRRAGARRHRLRRQPGLVRVRADRRRRPALDVSDGLLQLVLHPWVLLAVHLHHGDAGARCGGHRLHRRLRPKPLRAEWQHGRAQVGICDGRTGAVRQRDGGGERRARTAGLHVVVHGCRQQEHRRPRLALHRSGRHLHDAGAERH